MKQPGFIAVAGVEGYLRADRIEAVTRQSRDHTRIAMFAGDVFISIETPDEIFAKMADALHIPQGDDEP